MADINWNISYAPAQAEDGKFVVIDSNYLQTNFNYTSGGWGKFATLAYLVNSSINVNTTNISESSNTIWIGSSSFGVASKLTPTLPSTLTEIEIQNLSEGPIYVLLSSATYSDTITKGILLSELTYYTNKKQISNITIASVSGGEVRIIGHYYI